jgi:hypothetical protein
MELIELVIELPRTVRQTVERHQGQVGEEEEVAATTGTRLVSSSNSKEEEQLTGHPTTEVSTGGAGVRHAEAIVEPVCRVHQQQLMEELFSRLLVGADHST